MQYVYIYNYIYYIGVVRMVTPCYTHQYIQLRPQVLVFAQVSGSGLCRSSRAAGPTSCRIERTTMAYCRPKWDDDLDISWQNGEIFDDFWWCVRAASSWPIPPIPKVIGWISICFWCPPGSSAHSKTYGALNIGRRWRDAKPRPGRVPLKIWRIGCNHKGSRMV